MLPTRRVLLETGGEFQVLPRDESCLEHGSSKNDHQTFQEEEYWYQSQSMLYFTYFLHNSMHM